MRPSRFTITIASGAASRRLRNRLSPSRSTMITAALSEVPCFARIPSLPSLNGEHYSKGDGQSWQENGAPPRLPSRRRESRRNCVSRRAAQKVRTPKSPLGVHCQATKESYFADGRDENVETTIRV